MALGTFTKAAIELRAVELAEQLMSTMSQIEELRSRLASELAAGTLNGADFYPASDPAATADKANLMGFCDDMHNIWATRGGYVNYLIGL